MTTTFFEADGEFGDGNGDGDGGDDVGEFVVDDGGDEARVDRRGTARVGRGDGELHFARCGGGGGSRCEGSCSGGYGRWDNNGVGDALTEGSAHQEGGCKERGDLHLCDQRPQMGDVARSSIGKKKKKKVECWTGEGGGGGDEGYFNRQDKVAT